MRYPHGTRTVVTIALATALIGVACEDAAGPEAGLVAALALEAGLPKSGITGEPLPVPPAVVAKDARGRPVPGVEVRFDVQSGGGTVEEAAVVTGSDGVARAGEWRLGPVLGEQLLVATASTPGGDELRVVLRVQAAWRWTQLPPPLGDPELSGFRIHPPTTRGGTPSTSRMAYRSLPMPGRPGRGRSGSRR